MVEPHGATSFNRRVTDLVEHAPYITAAVTILLLAIMLDGIRTIDADDNHPWLDWAVVGLSIYACFAFVALPRLVATRPSRRREQPSPAMIRFAISLSPALVGLGAWAACLDGWAAVVGFATTAAALLLVWARITTLRRVA